MTGQELYEAYKGLYPMSSGWGDLSPEDRERYERDAKSGGMLGHTSEGTAKRVRRRQIEEAAKRLMEGPAGALMRSVAADMPDAPGHPDAARHVTGENLYEAYRKSHGEDGDWWALWEELVDVETEHYEQEAERARKLDREAPETDEQEDEGGKVNERDPTTLAGLRVRALLSERGEPVEFPHPQAAQQVKDDALLEVLAGILKRLEALERKAKPDWIGELQPDGSIGWKQLLENGTYVPSGPPPAEGKSE